LVEGRRKSRDALFREEADVVWMMPISIFDECAKRIEPAKLSRIFIDQTAPL